MPSTAGRERRPIIVNSLFSTEIEAVLVHAGHFDLEHVTVPILDDAGDRRDEMFVLAIIKYLLLVSYVGIEGQILNRAVVQYVTG